MPTVTGASEPVNAKVRDNGGQVYNVTHINYGADPTGTADSTVAVQAAMAACAASGGGVVLCPAGVYTVTDLWLPSGVTLAGVGVGVTILQRKATSLVHLSDAGACVLNAGSAVRTPYTNTAMGTGIRVLSLTVDFNGAAQNTWDASQSGDSVGGAAIDFRYVFGLVVVDVETKNAITEGCRTMNCPSARFMRCYSHHNGNQTAYSGRGNGFNFSGDAGTTAYAVNRQCTTVTDCESAFNCDEGFECDLVSDITFKGCNSHDNGTLSSASASSVYGYEFSGSAGGATPYPVRVIVADCHAARNNRSGSTTNGSGLCFNGNNPAAAFIIQGFEAYSHNNSAISGDFNIATVGQIIIDGVIVDTWGNSGAANDAVQLQFGTSAVAKGIELANIVIRNGQGSSRNGVGVLTKGSPAGTVKGLHATNITVDGAGAQGIVFLGNIVGFSLTNWYASATGDGVFVSPNGANAMADGVISDGYADTCGAIGVEVDAAGSGSIARIVVCNNSMKGCTGVAVKVGTGATQCRIVDNDVQSNSATGVTDSGTATVKTGNQHSAGARSGVAQLTTGGTVAVATAEILAGDVVRLTVQAPSGTQGTISLGTISAGTSFVINSTNSSDRSYVFWEIVH